MTIVIIKLNSVLCSPPPPPFRGRRHSLGFLDLFQTIGHHFQLLVFRPDVCVSKTVTGLRKEKGEGESGVCNARGKAWTRGGGKAQVPFLSSLPLSPCGPLKTILNFKTKWQTLWPHLWRKQFKTKAFGVGKKGVLILGLSHVIISQQTLSSLLSPSSRRILRLAILFSLKLMLEFHTEKGSAKQKTCL